MAAVEALQPNSGTQPLSAPKGAATDEPLESLAAYWAGSLTLEDFLVPDVEKFALPHNSYAGDDIIPVVDLSVIGSSDKAKRDANIAEMLGAAQRWGFFKISNHGVNMEIVKKLESHAHKFFALPLERKLMCKGESIWGYSAGSPPGFPKKWWSEGLQIQGQEEVIEQFVHEAWRNDSDYAEEVREDITAYIDATVKLATHILELLAEAQGLSSKAYSQYHTTQSKSSVRINHYPTCPQPDDILGLPAHRDPQMITILYQDDVGGLQVCRDGKWVGIRPDPTTFVVNIGDCMEALSNGRLKSAEHRTALNSSRNRFSILLFYNADDEVNLCVPPELVDAEHPLKFRPFTMSQYRKYVLQKTTLNRSIDFLRVKDDS